MFDDEGQICFKITLHFGVQNLICLDRLWAPPTNSLMQSFQHALFLGFCCLPMTINSLFLRLVSLSFGTASTWQLVLLCDWYRTSHWNSFLLCFVQLISATWISQLLMELMMHFSFLCCYFSHFFQPTLQFSV